MKKMLCAMMALVLLCGMLSGCSLFTSDNKTETNAPASTAADTAGSTEAAATDSKAPETTETGSGNAPVKMTDKECFFYCTKDMRYWVCPDCFKDFKNSFGWVEKDSTELFDEQE